MTNLETIYLVDDDDDCRFLVKEALVEAGLQVEVLEAENGMALFEILQDEVNEAIMILDVNMPKMNGIETVEILKNDVRWSSMPVFFLSTSSDEKLRARAYKAGATKFYVKPVFFEDFINLVKEIFRVAKEENR